MLSDLTKVNLVLNLSLNKRSVKLSYQSAKRTIRAAENCIFAQISGGLKQAHLLGVDAQLAL